MATKRVFKTTKKISGGRQVFRKWGEWEVGDIIIGKYVGNSIDRYKKPNWHIEVIEAVFSIDPKAAKELIGKTIGLNSAGQLNKAMEKLDEGDLIQVTYNGMEEMQGGDFEGKDAHLIEVDMVEEEDPDADAANDLDEEEESEEDDL